MSTRKIGSHLNFVHNDEIWKDHVRHELQSLRKWPEQWGLMTREYTRLHRRLIGERLTPEAGDSAYPSRCPSFSSCSDRSPLSSSRRSTPGFSSTRLPSILSSKPSAPSAETPPPPQLLAKLPTISAGGNPADVATPSRVAMKTFPLTTAGEIGWQSAKTEGKLEIYRRYAPNARGQHGILNLLNWPQQSIM